MYNKILRVIAGSFAAALIVFLVSTLFPSETAAQPTAQQIIANVRKESARVRDYSANLRVSVDMDGVNVPEMKAKIYFKAPDKIHLDTEGFAMIPRDAIAMNPNTFDESLFDMVIQGKEIADGTLCYKVKLLAKSDTLRIQRAMVVVDPDHWIMRKVEVDPLEGSEVEVRFEYTLIANTYFMPEKMILAMNAPPMKMFGKEGMMKDKADEIKPALIILNYSNYKVNKGIPDSVFKKDKK